MNTTECKTAKEKMKERNEQTVLCLQKKIGHTLFRYSVGERREEITKEDETKTQALSYSVYAEYETAEEHTYAFVTALTEEKEKAIAFCKKLLAALVTPLSLEAVYEDMLTP